MHPTAKSSSAVGIPLRSQALRCASHQKVKLCSVHHTVKSNCTPRSQNQNLCVSLVAFKGTIRRYPFRCEHIYHKRKDFNKFCFIFKLKILTLRCHAHRRVEFFELCDRITRRNRNRIRKYFSLFIRCPDTYVGPNHEKIEVKNLVTHAFNRLFFVL